MATVTPNFNWPVPTSTDLVKDGATAIEALGDSIDGAFVDLKGGTTGQVLAKATNTDLDFAWVAQDDSNAIQNSIVDAKGDLIAATANDTPARLAVGANGETLVADASTSTGLRYTSLFGANKNKIINGDFYINQRNWVSTVYSGSTFNNFGFDRFITNNAGDGTTTASPQTFTPGTAPVAGYEGKNFYRAVTAGFTNSASRSDVLQSIEDVRTLAGQTATVSFWAKAGSGTPKIALEMAQNFGTGGSPSTIVYTAAGTVTISTSWARYSITVAVPSISGKTIGTNNDSSLSARFWLNAGSDFNTRASSIGIQNNTFEIWGIQVEAGSVATAFQTMTGSIQGETSACQRYYVRFNAGNGYGNVASSGYTSTATGINSFSQFPVPMRSIPSAIDFANIGYLDSAGSGASVSSPSAAAQGVNFANIGWTTSGATTGRFAWLRDLAGAGTGYLGFSAEL